MKGERGDYVADWVSGALDLCVLREVGLVSSCGCCSKEGVHEFVILEVLCRIGPNLVSKFVREFATAV